MCKFSSKSGGVPFQPLGDLTWNDPTVSIIYKLQYGMLVIHPSTSYGEAVQLIFICH